MKPEEEDALVAKYSRPTYKDDDGIRLAIRAAYAKGREDGATEDEPQIDGWPLYRAIPPPADLSLAEISDGFGDPETLWNSRKWLQSSLESKGAKFLGGGLGCGQADIDIELEGCKFNVSIRPIAIRRGE